MCLVCPKLGSSTTTSLVVDVWIEHDLGTVFWDRTQAQCLQTWVRTFYKFP